MSGFEKGSPESVSEAPSLDHGLGRKDSAHIIVLGICLSVVGGAWQ